MDLTGQRAAYEDRPTQEGARSGLLYLHSEGLDVVCPICSPGEIREVELDLIPAVVQSHRHGAYEWFDSCCGLVIGGPKPSTCVLVVQNLPPQ